MQIWAGLGNPGGSYALHRHNVGYMAADVLAEAHRFSAPRKAFRSELREGRIGKHRILLLKPQTFMNISGEAVAAALRFYKLDLDALTVFHDELDLAPMKVKVKVGGGTAGHNGLRSIDAHLGPDVPAGAHRHRPPRTQGTGDAARVLGNYAKSRWESAFRLLAAIAAEAAMARRARRRPLH